MRFRLLAMLGALVLSSMAPADLASANSPKKYKNCAELNKVYPSGVARDRAAVGRSGAKVDAAVYKSNITKDRDKDGVACEKKGF